LWLRGTEGAWIGAVDDFAMWSSEQWGILARLGSGLPGLGSARSLFSCSIGLGEALFAGLVLPVVVPDSPAVDNHPAPELAEHAAGSDDGDLSRPIRKRQDLLADQIILLDLVGDDLEQRPVLVEE